MTNIKLFTLTATILILLMLLLAGSFYYKTEMELTPVITAVSPNGEAEMTIYQVGEPAWPFGPTDCRFDLRYGNKRVIKYSFSIHNDGAPAFENNFTISWHDDHVQVMVSAEEQFDVNYYLFYDGTVEESMELW